MSLTLDEVKRVAHLARIKITENEAAKYQVELNKIFDWIEQLQEVNTDNIEPLYSVAEHPLPLREDKVTDGAIKDDVLANAPEAKYDHFVVTKVVE